MNSFEKLMALFTQPCVRTPGMTPYIFHRGAYFYTVECVNDLQASHAVLLNPGTTRLENALTGEIIWDLERDGDPNPKTTHQPEERG